MFPREIVEVILTYCDGQTLINACSVNSTWQASVEYLTKQTDIWQKCCYSDIPKNELKQYLEKWVNGCELQKAKKWMHIYDNWLNWKNINANVEFKKVVQTRMNFVTCVSTVGTFTAIGFATGKVRIYNENVRTARTFRNGTIYVLSVVLVMDEKLNYPTEVLIHAGNKVYIHDFKNTDYNHGVFPDCYIFSAHKRFICGITTSGRITIGKITTDAANRSKSYSLITFVRVYAPMSVACCNLWEGVCTFLVNSKVKTIDYCDDALGCNVMAQEKTSLDMANRPQYLTHHSRIFNGNIIVALSRSCDIGIGDLQLFELFILGEKHEHSKKLFIPWHAYRANITAMFLYGNTFLIGTNTGVIYFYEVEDWKLFEIHKFSHAENFGKTSVRAIDVIECHGQRIFTVATEDKLMKIIGYSMPKTE